MIKIFADTSVWRHWLALKAEKSFSNPEIEKDAKAFDKIFDLACSRSHDFRLMYNNRVETELPEEYKTGHPYCFETIKKCDFIEKIPIPLTRCDGTDLHDGFVLHGGESGGTLRKILHMDGYNHEVELRNAPPNPKRSNPLHTNPRVKEFDMEHLESALEAKADIFLTNDYELIERLKRAKDRYSSDEKIVLAERMSFRPIEAILSLNSQ